MSTTPSASPAGTAIPDDKVPRTERGRRTLRRLLDAAAREFAERGFYDASISGITTRAGTALGSFYTYFNSKDEIFQALVKDMSEQVRLHAARSIAPGMTGIEVEGAALAGFLGFAREHKEVYRIIDEAEFVDPESYRRHYQITAQRMLARLQGGGRTGEFRDDLEEAHAWAIMGMNVFLGLRYCVWSDDLPLEAVVAAANSILREGICKHSD